MTTPHELFLQVLSETGDRSAAIRMIRKHFGLSLWQAKEVMLQAEGTASSLDEYQEQWAPALEEVLKLVAADTLKTRAPTPATHPMAGHRIFQMPFSKVYPLYIQKAEKKKRTKEEVDQLICWLTGYAREGLQKQIEKNVDFETFFAEAPEMHPNCGLIKGVVCGIRVEEIENPLMQKIRYLDKLIDELAKGKKLEKIMR